MEKIVLLVSKTLSKEGINSVQKISEAYRSQGLETRVVKETFFGLLRIIFLKAAVIDFHNAPKMRTLFLFRLFKKSCPKIFTIHERAEFFPGNNLIKRMQIRFRTFYAVKNCDEIIVTQKTLQVFFRNQFNFLPTYIPEGVSTLPSEKIPTPFGLKKDKYLVFVNNNSSVKIQRNPKSKRIEKTCTESEMTDLLKDCLGIILTSPLSVAKARQLILFKKPILALATTEHKEALGTGGIFFNNPKELKKLLPCLRLNKNQQKIRKTARQIENLFNWEFIAEEYLKVYFRKSNSPVKIDSAFSVIN